MEENKKNNAGLICIIIILIILLIGAIGYIVYDKTKSEDSTVMTTNKVEEISTTKTVSENKNIIETKDKEIDLTGAKETIKELYVNGHLVEVNNGGIIYTFEKYNIIDNNYILAKYSDYIGEGYGIDIIVDKNANIIYKASDLSSLKDAIGYTLDFKDTILTIKSTKMMVDFEYTVCKYNPEDTITMEETRKYLGNGIFGDSTIISKKTSDDIIRATFGASCEEIRKSTSKELERARELIKTLD